MASEGTTDPKPALPRWLIAVALVALAVAVAMTFLWIRDRDTSAADMDAQLRTGVGPVSERATTLTELLMDYNPGTLQQRSDQLLAISTGEFRDQYETLLKGGLGNALTKANTTAKAKVVDGPDVSFTSSREAQAILRVIQTAKKKGALVPRRIFYVLRFTLLNTSTNPDSPDWRASRLDILSQQST
jgi:hypothetical protein